MSRTVLRAAWVEIPGSTCLREAPEVKYAFIESGKSIAPLTKQFEWLGVSSSGYYDWLNRPEKPNKQAEQSSVIDETIRIAFEDRKHRDTVHHRLLMKSVRKRIRDNRFTWPSFWTYSLDV